MNNEVTQTTFDYGALDEVQRVRVQVKAESIRARMKRTAEDIIAIGQDLIDVKEELGHGRFLEWIRVEFGMSRWTAQNFMRTTERFGDKNANFAHLSASVLYELAAPSTPDAIIERVQVGEIPPNLDAIKEAKAAQKRAEEAEKFAHEEAQQFQQQLFQTRREAVDRVKSLQENYRQDMEHLNRQVAELNQQIATIQTPQKERVEVIPEATQKHLQSLEERVATLQRQKDNLKEQNEQLAKDLEVQEGVREQEERDARVRLEWKNATTAVSQSVLKFLGQLPLPADMQRFESDDWERLEQALDVLQRGVSACKSLRSSPVSMIIDATPARG